jgi:hypothetical protein
MRPPVLECVQHGTHMACSLADRGVVVLALFLGLIALGVLLAALRL